MEWYQMVWRKYAEFNGRARRKEYWMFQLLNCLMFFSLAMLGFVTGGGAVGSRAPLWEFPGMIYLLAVAMPSAAVSVRRLHDSGKSGWLFLLFAVLAAIPLVGLVSVLIQIIFYCLDSDPGDNRYGPNPKAAVSYHVGAVQGDAAAQYNLGIMYDVGRGVPQDYAQAAVWYRKAAEQGYAPAQSNLGAAYWEGQGVPQDYTQAVVWYRKAASQGDATAQFNLGVAFLDGLGVPRDFAEALSWLDRAASGKPETIGAADIARLRAEAVSRLVRPSIVQALGSSASS